VVDDGLDFKVVFSIDDFHRWRWRLSTVAVVVSLKLADVEHGVDFYMYW
jgi:hypothetical protein